MTGPYLPNWESSRDRRLLRDVHYNVMPIAFQLHFSRMSCKFFGKSDPDMISMFAMSSNYTASELFFPFSIVRNIPGWSLDIFGSLKMTTDLAFANKKSHTVSLPVN